MIAWADYNGKRVQVLADRESIGPLKRYVVIDSAGVVEFTDELKLLPGCDSWDWKGILCPLQPGDKVILNKQVGYVKEVMVQVRFNGENIDYYVNIKDLRKES